MICYRSPPRDDDRPQASSQIASKVDTHIYIYPHGRNKLTSRIAHTLRYCPRYDGDQPTGYYCSWHSIESRRREREREKLTYSDSEHGYALRPGFVRRDDRVGSRVASAVGDDYHKRRAGVAHAQEHGGLVDPARGVRSPPCLDVVIDKVVEVFEGAERAEGDQVARELHVGGVSPVGEQV